MSNNNNSIEYLVLFIRRLKKEMKRKKKVYYTFSLEKNVFLLIFKQDDYLQDHYVVEHFQHIDLENYQVDNKVQHHT